MTNYKRLELKLERVLDRFAKDELNVDGIVFESYLNEFVAALGEILMVGQHDLATMRAVSSILQTRTNMYLHIPTRDWLRASRLQLQHLLGNVRIIIEKQ